MCGMVLATEDENHSPTGIRSKAKPMRQDPDPWFSSEFWQRAVLGILTLALAFLLASPADAATTERYLPSSAVVP